MTLSRRLALSALTLAATARLAPAAQAANDLGNAVRKAMQGDGWLLLPPGDFPASAITIDGPLTIEGIAGRTRIVATGQGPLLLPSGPAPIVLRGLTFDGNGKAGDDALVSASGAGALVIEDCHFMQTKGSGLRLEGCGGRVSGNRFDGIGGTAIFARDSRGLEISGNTLVDIGNNGIQVWTSANQACGTIVSRNRISRVRADGGGSGQNGNGINVYRAGSVIVSENRITDCAFSAVRNNAGDNCHILGNSIARMGEVAIYCEFGFEGAVVSGNIIEDVALGISVTNFNEGGRLASVANNVVRRATGGGIIPQTNGIGIGAEGDCAISGNVIEDTRDAGITLGWGPYSRSLSATGNVIRNTQRGIVFSVSEGADGVLIAHNRIAGTATAILGADHGEPRTGDLGLPGGDIPAGTIITGNLVS